MFNAIGCVVVEDTALAEANQDGGSMSKVRLAFAASLLLWPLSLNAADSVTYTYDALNRLTQAKYSNGTTIDYTYDAAGNRLTQVVTKGPAQPPVALWGTAVWNTFTWTAP